MEEEKKELVQEEKDEQYLKLKKSNNRKKAVIIILLFIIVLAGLLLFIFFSDKKEEPKKEDNKQEEKQEENKQEEQKQEEPEEIDEDYSIKNGIELTKTDKVFVVNGNTIKLRVADSDSGYYDLYVNNTKVEEDIFVDHAISMDKYLLLYGQNAQCGIVITHYIDENGKVNKIENNLTTEEVQYLAVKDVDGTFNAHMNACPEYKAELDFDVKFVYTNNKLQVVKAN